MKWILQAALGIVLLTFSTQFQFVKIGAIFFDGEFDLSEVLDNVIREINERELKVRLLAVKHFIKVDDSVVLQALACDLIGQGVSAILGPSSKTSSEIVELLCQQRGVPHLQYDWHKHELYSMRRQHQLTVNVAPSKLILSMAYADILKYLNWKSFTIVFEESMDLGVLQNIIAADYMYKSSIKMKSFRRNEDYRVLWKHVNDAREKYIILHCPSDILSDVVRISIGFNMTKSFNNLFLTNLDTHVAQLWQFYTKDFLATTTAVRIRSYIPAPREDEIDALQDDEEDSFSNLQKELVYDAVVLFFNAVLRITRASKYTEPRISCKGGFWDIGPKIVDQMKMLAPKNVTPPYKTQRLFLNENGLRDDFNLMIYNPLFETTSHFWNKQKRLVAVDDVIIAKEEKLKRFRKIKEEDISKRRVKYTVATRVGEPYFMWKDVPEGEHYEGNERFKGYAVELINKLSEECNFDFVFEPVIDNNYGTYDHKTKEWNGIIRQLIDNNAQMGICDLTITQARRSVVDFTMPFMQLGISILKYREAPPEPVLFAFLNPFTVDVWIYLLLSIVGMSFLAVIIGRLSPSEWVNSDIIRKCNTTKVVNIWNICNTLWLNIGSMMQQGSDILPRGAPMRIYVASFWIFALIISQTYIAKLAAVITSAKMKPTINSLKDLVGQSKVQFGFLKGGSTAVLFSESNNSDYRIAWHKMEAMKPDAFTISNKEGVDRVLRSRGDYAFLMETTSLQYYIGRNCNLTQMGVPFGEKHYGIAVPLNAPYRSNLSVGILKLSEKGILYKLKTRWFNNNNNTKCVENDGTDAGKLTMKAFSGLFLVLLAGILVACIIGIYEFLLHVQNIAVKGKVSNCTALKAELNFVLCFWKKRKPLKTLSAKNNYQNGIVKK